jgi:hypothetical protein
MPDDDLWPNYPCTRPDLFAPDVPAPASFWRCLIRHAQTLGEPLAAVTATYGRALLECRPVEGEA